MAIVVVFVAISWVDGKHVGDIYFMSNLLEVGVGDIYFMSNLLEVGETYP